MPRLLPPWTRLAPVVAVLAAGAAHAQDQLVAQALKRIEKVEGQVESLEPGDVATANRHINDLNYAAKRLRGAYDKTTEHYKKAAERYNALVSKIQEIANAGAPAPEPGQPALDLAVLAQLDKEIGNALHNFGLLNVTHMGDGFRVGSIEKAIANFRERLGALPAEHPAVKPVAERLQHFADSYQKLRSAYLADAGSADERAAVMDALHKKYVDLEFGAIQPPYQPQQVAAWVQRSREIRKGIADDLATLESVKGSGGVHGRKWQGVHRWIGSDWVRKLGEAESQVANYIQGALSEVDRNTTFVLETDASDGHHVANRLLGEGNFDEQMQRLRKNLNDVDVAMAWEKGFGRTEAVELLGKLRKKTESAVTHLQQAAEAALGSVRVPVAASTDAKLRKIAEEVFANDKYGVGEVSRFVINSDVQHRDMHTGDIRSGTVTSTINVYHYVWDEFQVCSVEKVGDDYWLFYNTIKKFESGGPTTPLNRWLMSGRFKSIRILEENISLDPAPKGDK